MSIPEISTLIIPDALLAACAIVMRSQGTGLRDVRKSVVAVAQQLYPVPADYDAWRYPKGGHAKPNAPLNRVFYPVYHGTATPSAEAVQLAARLNAAPLPVDSAPLPDKPAKRSRKSAAKSAEPTMTPAQARAAYARQCKAAKAAAKAAATPVEPIGKAGTVTLSEAQLAAIVAEAVAKALSLK